MPFDLAPVEMALVIAAVMAGALTQGAIGIGLGLVLVPVLAVLAPASLPATPLLIAVPLTGLLVGRERHAIDTSGLAALFAGRIVGTVLAVLLLLWLSEPTLEILFGAVIVVVVLVSVTRPSIRPTLAGRIIGGTASGLFATTTSIGGPPLAVLYQQRPGPELRSTLNLVFFAGGLLSLGGLVAADRLAPEHFLLALAMAAPMAAGFLLSRPLAGFLDRGWLRPAVLAFAAAGGLLAIIRGLTT